MFSSWQDRTTESVALAKTKKEKKEQPSGSAFSFMTHGFVCLPPFHPQLLPEGLLLWPRLLCQHGGGEHGGEGGEDEVGRDPLSFLHPALPLYELPGASGQVRRASLYRVLRL